MKVVLNIFTGELLLVPVAAGAVTPITDSVDTEDGMHLTTEAGDYLVPEV